MTYADVPFRGGPVFGGHLVGLLYLVIIACGIGGEVFLRVLAPGLSDDVAPACAIPLAAELAFALWLVVRGLGPNRT